MMNLKALVLLPFCLMLSLPSAFAGWNKKPVFSWMQFYRWDRHFNTNGIYANRYALTFGYLDGEKRTVFKATPFYEMRRNYGTNEWERREVGVEVGKDILPCLYLGESIQHVWRNEEIREPKVYEKQNSLEAETRFVFSGKTINHKFI